MTSTPSCPKCQSEFAYRDGNLWICPECAHEWSAEVGSEEDAPAVIRDAVGNVLQDGDSVTVIRDLKIKGSSQVIKVGTRVRSIRLLHEVTDGHDIDCKIEGFGPMKLRSDVVKKA